MEFFYAQLDSQNVVHSVTLLAGEETSASLIKLDSYDLSVIGKQYNADGTFTDVPITLEQAQSAKSAEIQAAHDKAMYSTFQSAALDGTTLKTYDYSQKSADRLKEMMDALKIATSITTIPWATYEDGFVDHTRDQITQVYVDSLTHKQNVEMQQVKLNAQNQACTTVDEVNAIVVSF